MQNLAMYQYYSIQYSVLLSASPFPHVSNDQISCFCFPNYLSLYVDMRSYRFPFIIDFHCVLFALLIFLPSAKEGAINFTFGHGTSLNHWHRKVPFITTFLTQHLSTLSYTSIVRSPDKCAPDKCVEWLVGVWNFASEIHVIQVQSNH